MNNSGTHHGTHTGDPFTFQATCQHGHTTTWTAYPDRSLPNECPTWHDSHPVPLRPAYHEPQPWHARLRNLLRGYQ